MNEIRITIRATPADPALAWQFWYDTDGRRWRGAMVREHAGRPQAETAVTEFDEIERVLFAAPLPRATRHQIADLLRAAGLMGGV